jgi:LemA protein
MGIGAIVLVLIAVYLIFSYNSLVSLRNKVEESWSSIDVQLKRRYELIPNLVNTVKGYAAHESGTLEKVIQARNSAMAASSSKDVGAQVQAEQGLAGALKSVFALAESYPDLKANTNFLELQRSLSDIEETVANARRYYNAIVRDNNTKVESFPTNIIAQSFNFEKATFFELDSADERTAPKVNF